MTVTTPNAAAAPRTAPDLSRHSLPLGRRFRDRFATVLIAAALLVAIVPLGVVVYEVITRGGSAMSLDFLTADIPHDYRAFGPGMGPAITGTLLITGLAALIAIPLGVLGAIYLNEYGKQSPLARFIRTMADVMTGVPSIMMGLFIYVMWVENVETKSGFAGSLALACLMLPIVIRSSEEMLRLVPDELRQASAALGARKWRTTLTVVLPSAISGITSGSLLAIARAAGETAPIVVTVGLAFLSNPDLINGGNTTLAAQIFRNATQPFAASTQRAWGAALTLVVIVLLFTIIARFVASRFATKEH
ncbi:MAG TPA: phosphate ABC transporter permease PstA [Stackebrandtia sp.]|jgi:phosphate transport system permease protein|uniref:phosphate ABC transporter permease PstA n=1 Tax=Stackebrandtia sp. TaxID=2023065 RepID=UPI002D659B7C|nr:phosphate ABC transporter permease PstA [Stackebrandtia sp.]HZE37405.1 phosphate ABC transporter permease PstA [Stackebrandtia sp.]